MSEIEELENELEILIWNYGFKLYTKEYFEKEYKRILKQMERLGC